MFSVLSPFREHRLASLNWSGSYIRKFTYKISFISLLSFKNLNWNSEVKNDFFFLAFTHSLPVSMQSCLLSERERECNDYKKAWGENLNGIAKRYLLYNNTWVSWWSFLQPVQHTTGIPFKMLIFVLQDTLQYRLPELQYKVCMT